MISTLPVTELALGSIGDKAYVIGGRTDFHIQIPAGATVTIERTCCPGSMLGTDANDAAATADWVSDGDEAGPQIIKIVGPLTAIRLTAVTEEPAVYILRA